MLARLRKKYGEPAVTPGEFLSDQRYRWRNNGIDIVLQKTFGCHCSRLLYSEPNTLLTVQQQHRQVQRQRAEEHIQAFDKAF